MNKLTKITLLALLLFLALPMRQFAQTPYRQYADDGVLLDFFQIEDFYFRVYLLYNLNQNDQFILTQNEEWGQFSVNSNDENGITNFYDAFEAFYNNAYTDFGFLSKTDIDDRMSIWKNCIPDTQFLSLTMDIVMRSNRPNNNHCIDSDPFCTSDVITFDAATSSQTADTLEGTTLQDGCIGSSYNPSWFHMRIQTGGQFIIHMEGHDPNNYDIERDIDFCMWGPYSDPTSPCVAQLTTDKIIDCCYSVSYSEDIYLGYQPSNHTHQTSHGTVYYHLPQVGEYYILMITNYSRQPCTISFTKTANSGPGEADCGILPGVVTNDGPYCVGETIHLSVNAQEGAAYSWTGPNGYTSNQQNPIRPNCTLNMAGTYTCTTTVGSQSVTSSTEVIIYPMPIANFNTNSPVYLGNAIQFNSTSTGQNIISYQWDFGDGQSGTGQNTSHIYAQPGNYQATLTVQTSNGCSDQTIKPVTVNPLPSYTITVEANPTVGGTVSGGGTYQQDQQCTVSATPASNFTFLRWTENGSQVSLDASHTFPVTGNRTLVAHFNENIPEYTITVIADPANGGEVSGEGTYPLGASCVLTAYPNTGFVFENWTHNGIEVSTSPTYDFEVTRDATYVAHFMQDTNHCTITAMAEPVEGGAVLGGGTYELGAQCTLSAITAVGFEFVNWTTQEGAQVSIENPFSFPVTSNAVYVAHFGRIVNHYTITANEEPAGAGSVIGAGTFDEGDNCTLIAMPNPMYSFVSWTENGIVVDTNDHYTFRVDRDRNFVAVFSQGLFYTITASAGENGTISPEGEEMVMPGEDKTFSMIPNSGCQVSKVLVDGVDRGPIPSYTFRNVDRDHTIHVEFSGLGLEDNTHPELKTYPNPANDKINIESPNMKAVTAFNLLGVQISSMEVNNDHATLNVEGFSQGTFVLKVEYGDGSVGYSRFVVTK